MLVIISRVAKALPNFAHRGSDIASASASVHSTTSESSSGSYSSDRLGDDIMGEQIMEVRRSQLYYAQRNAEVR